LNAKRSAAIDTILDDQATYNQRVQAESDLENISKEINDLNDKYENKKIPYRQHAQLMQEMEGQRAQNQYNELQRQLSGQAMTEEERQQYRIFQARNQIWQQMQGLVPGSEAWNNYNDMLNNGSVE